MRLRNIFLIYISCLLSLDTLSQEFIVSKDIRIELPQAPVIAHSGGSVLFKYPDWVLSHEALNPKTFYAGVDLTGQLQTYIRNIFEPKKGDLVSWLQIMAKEQAAAFKVTDKNSSKFQVKEFTVYSVFDGGERNGHVFLLGKDYASHFNIISDEQEFLAFLALLKGSI